LPDPLRAFALGIRALPYICHLGDEPVQPGPWCYYVLLWANPVVAHREQWDWYGQQRQVMVGLEFVVSDMFGLDQLQCVGQALHWLQLVEAICCIPDVEAREEAYRMHV
jgi:hypothetical protein